MAYDERSLMAGVIDAAAKRQDANNKLKAEILKMRLESKMRQQESQAKTQSLMRTALATKMMQNRMQNPQQYTPEQLYLRRRAMEENPLMAMVVPEDGQNFQGITFPQNEVIRDPKTNVYSEQSITQERQTQLLSKVVETMLAQGRKPHPAVMAILEKQKQYLGGPKYDPETGQPVPKQPDGKGTIQNFNATTKARQEFLNRPEVKDYVTVSTNVRSMDALLDSALSGDEENKVALDQGLITFYNKLTDPASVVRESEYARTAQNVPLMNQIQGAIEKAKAGGAGLTDKDRKALILAAKIIANERGKTFNSTLKEYAGLAGQYGFDPSLVTRGMQEHQDFDLGGESRAVVRTGTIGDKRVIEYSDGSVEYAA